MIKRRFFRFEHGNRDDPSGSSSSSDESEVEVDASDESEVEEDVGEKGESSSSSGYESEDSSENEVNLDSSGLPTSDDDVAVQNIIGSRSGGKGDTKLATAQRSPEKDGGNFDTMGCVLKRKSVFKCRLCPRIVCLSEETLKAHLNSKRHARSVKLLKEGRLKRMLNEAGKVEEETYSDNPDTSPVSEQKSSKPKKKKKGPWKRKKGSKPETKSGKAKPSTDKREKRRKDDS